MRYSIGIDVGGTFTDLVLVDEKGSVTTYKSSTTPENFTDGVFDALKLASNGVGLPLEELLGNTLKFVYGSTIVTNTIIQRAGAKAALLTTKGFRDTLVLRRMIKEEPYNLFEPYPEPFVAREFIKEITERIDADGNVIIPIDLGEIRRTVRSLAKEDIRAIAVCYLHSYINPTHELHTAELIREEFPHIYCTASCELVPEIREYERTSTTVLNAYIAASVVSHWRGLERRLIKSGLTVPLLIMLSHGGVASVDEACRAPIFAISSGPVGGVMAAKLSTSTLQTRNVITVDMGGTSLDVGLLIGGAEMTGMSSTVEKWAVTGISAEVNSIGAGGGSIAWVDEMGVLKVGPQSAGAVPGPVCYDRGGTYPTLTDALVVLGYIDPEYFLGGRMKLKKELAEQAVKKLADRMGVGLLEAASGVFEIAIAKAVDAIRLVLSLKGQDPRDFIIVSFGGCGPTCGGRLCMELNAQKALVPDTASTHSAFGLLTCDLKHSYSHTLRMELAAYDYESTNRTFREMEEAARKALKEERIDEKDIRIEPSIDMSYVGQLWDVNIPIKSTLVDSDLLAKVEQEWRKKYSSLYRVSGYGLLVQQSACRLDGIGKLPIPRLKREQLGKQEPAAALKGERRVYFRDGGLTTIPVYEAARLVPGNKVRGPAVIEHVGTTVLVLEGQQAFCDELRNIAINMK